MVLVCCCQAFRYATNLNKAYPSPTTTEKGFEQFKRRPGHNAAGHERLLLLVKKGSEFKRQRDGRAAASHALTQCAAHRAQGWLQVGTEDAVVILALCPPSQRAALAACAAELETESQ